MAGKQPGENSNIINLVELKLILTAYTGSMNDPNEHSFANKEI